MKFKIIITDECKEEMDEIYEYISCKLKEKEIAEKLILKVFERVSDLREAPRLVFFT